jgi:phosphatidylglycerol---prolipoprotein diacylglyceryl transferase
LRSTLFYIPHSLGPLPIFGLGWALIIFVLAAIVWGYYEKKASGSCRLLSESLPFLGLSAAAIVFLVPLLESRIGTGETERILGLPVRGYGVMLLLGALSGLAIILPRANRVGISLDTLLSLAFWSFIPGIIGARLFFVIQKWDEFPGRSFADKLPSVLKFTEGGLVVYGGIIGGLLGMAVWCRFNKQPILAIMDLIAPGYMIGQALGRVGCFLHGCCFGGICDQPLPNVVFPSGSPAYMAQLESGDLLGLTLAEYDSSGHRTVKQVRANSWAEANGIKVGQVVEAMRPTMILPGRDQDPAGAPTVELDMLVDGRAVMGDAKSLPQVSRRVHPTQLYSTTSAFLICMVLYFLWPATKRDGQVFAIGIVLVGISRIFEEIIRSDEIGFAGSQLTIAQWISVAGIGIGIAIIAIQSRRNAQRIGLTSRQ